MPGEEMPFRWPVFEEAVPIDSVSSWTAVQESYDQRNDDCYYIVTLLKEGAPVRSFMVKVDVGWAGDDWTTPEFARRLEEEIGRAARRGETNTDYPGPLAR
jgi:hypothetical protein